MNPPIDPFALSNDPKILEKAYRDPLIARLFPLQVFQTLGVISSINKSDIYEFDFNYPLLIFSGEKDPITPPMHSKWLFNKLKCSDKILRIIQNGDLKRKT